ncbi:hypothetical protein J008_05204 [Cryptococcus neoformans]|nr:hypothetical protein J008_05204 [Cryptococcus neoformans var. grubii]
MATRDVTVRQRWSRGQSPWLLKRGENSLATGSRRNIEWEHADRIPKSNALAARLQVETRRYRCVQENPS